VGFTGGCLLGALANNRELREMRYFWDNIVPLAGIACLAFFLYGLGQLIFDDMEKRQERYEQCIAADKQWVLGSCLK
jgi:hypothetical protein